MSKSTTKRQKTAQRKSNLSKTNARILFQQSHSTNDHYVKSINSINLNGQAKTKLAPIQNYQYGHPSNIPPHNLVQTQITEIDPNNPDEFEKSFFSKYQIQNKRIHQCPDQSSSIMKKIENCQKKFYYFSIKSLEQSYLQKKHDSQPIDQNQIRQQHSDSQMEFEEIDLRANFTPQNKPQRKSKKAIMPKTQRIKKVTKADLIRQKLFQQLLIIHLIKPKNQSPNYSDGRSEHSIVRSCASRHFIMFTKYYNFFDLDGLIDKETWLLAFKRPNNNNRSQMPKYALLEVMMKLNSIYQRKINKSLYSHLLNRLECKNFADQMKKLKPLSQLYYAFCIDFLRNINEDIKNYYQKIDDPAWSLTRPTLMNGRLLDIDKIVARLNNLL